MINPSHSTDHHHIARNVERVVTLPGHKTASSRAAQRRDDPVQVNWIAASASPPRNDHALIHQRTYIIFNVIASRGAAWRSSARSTGLPRRLRLLAMTTLIRRRHYIILNVIASRGAAWRSSARSTGLPRRPRLLVMTTLIRRRTYIISTSSRAAERRGDPVQGQLDCRVGFASSQ
jgi:hypothetical protein